MSIVSSESIVSSKSVSISIVIGMMKSRACSIVVGIQKVGISFCLRFSLSLSLSFTFLNVNYAISPCWGSSRNQMWKWVGIEGIDGRSGDGTLGTGNQIAGFIFASVASINHWRSEGDRVTIKAGELPSSPPWLSRGGNNQSSHQQDLHVYD